MNCKMIFCFLALFVFLLMGCSVEEPYVNPITMHSFNASADVIEQNATVVLSVSATSKNAGALSYQYQLLSGGGILSVSSNCNVTYTAPSEGGPFQVKVTITDSAAHKNSFVQTFWRGKKWEMIMSPTTINIGDGDRFQSVAVARDGTLYVTYQRWGTGTIPMNANCYRYDSGSWALVGRGQYRNFHIDSVAGDHYPYLVFVNRKYSTAASQLQVWKYGDSTSDQQACFTNTINKFFDMGYADSNRPRLALGSDNTLYLTCRFWDYSAPPTPERDRFLSVFQYQTASTNWVCIGSNMTTAPPNFVSLIVDKGNNPVIAYQTDRNKTFVKQYKNGSWVQLGSSSISTGVAGQPSLAVDPSGSIYIAYHDGLRGDKLTVQQYTREGWKLVGKAGFTEGTAQWITLLFDSHGIPYVVFQNGALAGRASCMRYDGTDWVYVGNPAGSAYGASYIDAAIGPDDTIYAAYRSLSGRYGTGVLRLK